jgi:hypothetical protein
MSDLEAADPAETMTAVVAAERPVDVPEKFWDAATGAVHTDTLLKSYVELERKLGSSRGEPEPAIGEALPAGLGAAAFEAVEAPAAPESYTITAPHPLIEPDDEINARLRDAGFTQPQAQLVYDLAADRLLPMLHEALGEIEAQQQVERLQRQFGGPESWRHTARQLKSRAASNLSPDVHATLASSYDGVLAMHQMMRASEPELLAADGLPAVELTQDTLTEMMRDPRYWRQRDPEFIARVTAGFKRLYAD